MGVESYRNTLQRQTKERSGIEEGKAGQQKKVGDLTKDIGDARKSLSRASSASMQRTYLNRIERKQKDLARAQKELARIDGKLASKAEEIHRTLKSLEQAEASARRRQQAADKERRRDEQRHADEMTRAARQQARIHQEMTRNPVVINLAGLPRRIAVLFLAANPLDQNPLQLAEEHRTIAERIRASEYRDAVVFESRWAVRASDLQQALNECQPHVVHFSGHGDQDEILLQNADGSSKPVTKTAIAATLRTTGENVQVVVFNSCFSSSQAETVTEHIDIAIGMNESIGDDAARVFAGQFYSAIGFGRSVRNAFDQATSELMLHGISEEAIPELHAREGIDPDAIVLVRPPGL